MVACEVCGESDQFLFECQQCGDQFCGEHQEPDAHHCSVASVDTGDVDEEDSPSPKPAQSRPVPMHQRLRSVLLTEGRTLNERLPSSQVTLTVAVVLLVLGILIGGVAIFAPSLAQAITSEFDEALADGGDGDAQSSLNQTEIERLVANRVNTFRVEQGVSPVSYDSALAHIARYHSQDMADRNYTGHVGPDGETLADRFEQFDYSCDSPGELILFTQHGREIQTVNGTVRFDTESELATGVLNLWLQSPAHREALLTTTWEQIGVGVVVTDDNRVFVTLNAC